LNRALELNPNDKQSLFNRGLVRQKLNNFRGALSDYNKAIEINPNNAVYWAQRSVVKELLEDDLGALEDLDKALDLSKNYVWALRRRANVLSRNGQHELSIIDRIRYYENELVPKVEDDDPEFKEIYSEIHDHFHRVIKRKIENSSEKLIEYWPCFMYWGLEIGSTVSQGRSGFVHRGKYGMGYLCLSTKTLRIISIGTLSRKYARGLGMGPVRRFLLVLTNNFDMSSVERNDVVWEVPFSSIQGIALHDETLSVNTSVENWRVSASLPEHDQAIFAFLNLARSGGLNNVIDPRRLRLSQQKGTATSSDEIFKNIERLASLLNSGAITQEDFDQKKKELLARL